MAGLSDGDGKSSGGGVGGRKRIVGSKRKRLDNEAQVGYDYGMKHKLSTSGIQQDLLGFDKVEYQLDIWQDDNNKLLVRLMKDGKAYATQTFRDSETQHSDSERWLNEQVGYPNPFAGILLRLHELLN